MIKFVQNVLMVIIWNTLFVKIYELHYVLYDDIPVQNKQYTFE